ncbi:MAG: c-type cytochrome [Gemmataceae bacterium]
MAEHPNPAVRRTALAVLKRGGALPSPDRQKVIDEFLTTTKEKGDPAVGKAVFKAQCAKCHKHQGEGENIGPDLTGMAVHPKEELLVHILDPSRSVEGNFRLYRVTKKDGSLVNGMLASESRTAVELVDADGKRHPILRDDIEELTGSNKSLMPDGFEKQVGVKDMAHLLRFYSPRRGGCAAPAGRVATSSAPRTCFSTQQGGQAAHLPGLAAEETFKGVPFVLVDPQGQGEERRHAERAERGAAAADARAVTLPFGGRAKAVHLLSGVGGWNAQGPRPDGPVGLTVRLRYDDGREDHPLGTGFTSPTTPARWTCPARVRVPAPRPTAPLPGRHQKRPGCGGEVDRVREGHGPLRARGHGRHRRNPRVTPSSSRVCGLNSPRTDEHVPGRSGPFAPPVVQEGGSS